MHSTMTDHRLRDELTGWALPLIGDVVRASYRQAALDDVKVDVLARLHILQFQHLLLDRPECDTTRRRLLSVAATYGIAESAILEIEGQVLVELMHVISRRFQRSSYRTRDCGLEVMRVACWLTAASKAA